MGYASLHSESTERKARSGLLSGPVSVAQKPGRGGEMEEQEATWGGLHGAVCLLMLVQEARAGGWRSALPGTWLEPSWVLTLH